jgi:hypothetical protein
MEPLLIILVPGIVGGIAIALLVSGLRPGAGPATRTRLEPPSPGLINMAHIRVDGIGGLGMVAMAITVAIFVPRIRLTMILALLLGAAFGAVLIVLRRRSGPLSSGNGHPGAHSMLLIDDAQDAVAADRGECSTPVDRRPPRIRSSAAAVLVICPGRSSPAARRFSSRPRPW